MSLPSVCQRTCGCQESHGPTEFVVLTGGPGAGKTAVLEFVRKVFCEHVLVLPEAASILFSGGFWRLDSDTSKKSAQRAIYFVQRELERMAASEGKWPVALCDRGTLDGLAYWPDAPEKFFAELDTDLATEYRKYKAVIHLRTPKAAGGYNNRNPVRIETAEIASAIDSKIHEVWKNHPNYFVVESAQDFSQKLQMTVSLLKTLVPDCCQHSLKGEKK